MSGITDGSMTRSVEEHLAEILAAVQVLPSESIAVRDAIGRTVAHDVLAAEQIPVFDNAAMDGFAVRRADVASASPDTPVVLEVVADIPAGSHEDPALGPGQAARIMTGAPIPTDADAVVPVEQTVEGFTAHIGDSITVRQAPTGAGHIRKAGEDLRVGDVVVPAGTRIGPFQASAMNAAGVAFVDVAAAPRVAIVSTGSELRTPGEILDRGEIPESNSALLAGLVEAAGGVVAIQRKVLDDPELLHAVVDGLADIDVVIMSGGVSAGAYEPVRQAFGATGQMRFVHVAMQPGKPQGFGRLENGRLLFGFPGNPVSVAVSFEMFARPALLALQGRSDIHRPRIRIPAAESWRTPRGRRQLLPAVVDRSDPERWTVRPAHAGGSGSHMAGGLARAEAIAIIPAEVDVVEAGDLVDVMLVW